MVLVFLLHPLETRNIMQHLLKLGLVGRLSVWDSPNGKAPTFEVTSRIGLSSEIPFVIRLRFWSWFFVKDPFGACSVGSLWNWLYRKKPALKPVL